MDTNQQALYNYVKEGLKQGNSPAELKSRAIQMGYPLEEINSALSQYQPAARAAAGDLTKTFAENKKRWIFGIPKVLVFPLTWTLFFVVIGIVVQSISAGSFVFFGFFWTNLIEWFSTFGALFSATQDTVKDILITLIKGAYYFGFVGGLISIFWHLLSLLIGKAQIEGKETKGISKV